MKKYILVGGLLWLTKKWLMGVNRKLRKSGLKYGDRVVRYKTDAWGKSKKISGLLIKKDFIPKVFLDYSIGGVNLINWDESFKKEN